MLKMSIKEAGKKNEETKDLGGKKCVHEYMRRGS